MTASRYSNADLDKPARVQALFSSIAGRYDLINDLQSFGFHRLWKRRVVSLASVGPGSRAIDLCCGSGDIAEALARTGAEVTGIDFNSAMLDVARRRLGRRKDLRIRYEQGDALALPFDDGTFDAATMGYGLRNLADFDKGIAEALRLVRPGGRLVILDFGKPDSPTLRKIYFSYLRYFVPLLGAATCGDRDAYSYILDSLEIYPGQNAVDHRLASLGCSDRKVITLLGGMMSINAATKPR